MKLNFLFFLFILYFIGNPSHAQQLTKKELEQKRIKLQKEIKEIQVVLFKNKKEQASLLSALDDLTKKISTRTQLINAINDEAEELSMDIIANEQEMAVLQDRLKELKTEYAEMVVHMYKNTKKQSRIMFLLSSKDFSQAYKRMQYLRQYADYHKKQGEEIKINADRLTDITDSLRLKENEKRSLLSLYQKEKDSVDREKKYHQELVNQVRAKEKYFTAQIKAKQAEDRKIDREIQRIITAAMAKSNTNKRTNASGFALTPEDKKLESSFVANKGKLPWPTERGIIVRKFGNQKHPTLAGIIVPSSGIQIATEEKTNARSVFKGKVMAIMKQPQGQKTVMIQHGNYITAYKNLDKVFVKENQIVDTKQNLGIIHTDVTNGRTILAFSVFKKTIKQDPEPWISKR
ncbi:peptidoglycan DD-metalloendopeptidase family protein [Flavobacteriaceae bacterium F08102]|nr:peptidoglycan DD-metalloendopeptidase family protein [Flavobacteriaceae bacterium F08102]